MARTAARRREVRLRCRPRDVPAVTALLPEPPSRLCSGGHAEPEDTCATKPCPPGAVVRAVVVVTTPVRHGRPSPPEHDRLARAYAEHWQAAHAAAPSGQAVDVMARPIVRPVRGTSPSAVEATVKATAPDIGVDLRAAASQAVLQMAARARYQIAVNVLGSATTVSIGHHPWSVSTDRGRSRRQKGTTMRGSVDVQPRGGSGCQNRPDPQERVVDTYFDFSCPYSRRTGRWWRELDEAGRWRPFVLRESHREDDGLAEWDRDDALDRVSVLALALHEAVDAVGGDTASYRWRTIDAFDAGRVDGPALRRLAEDAAGQSLDDERLREGLSCVARSHRDAVALRVFGTPTLVEGDACAYLKLAEQPSSDRARAVHDTVLTVLSGAPEVAEIKRPG